MLRIIDRLNTATDQMVYSCAMVPFRKTLLLCLMGLMPVGLRGQYAGRTPVQWSAQVSSATVRPGELLEVRLTATIEGNWHLYSATQPPGGPNPTRFNVAPGTPFEIFGKPRQSTPTTEFDPNFGIETEYFKGEADFWIPLRVSPDAAAGEYDLQMQAVYQVCDEKVCLPPKRVPIPLKVLVAGTAASEAVTPPGVTRPPQEQPQSPKGIAAPPERSPGARASGAAEADQPIPSTPVSPPPEPEPQAERTLVGTAADIREARASGLLPFMWLAMTMGAVSLATPCVFPMIPITISYFTKNAEKNRAGVLKQALVYSLGIVFTFTVLGIGLAALLGATGINQFAANPWVNLLITLIFFGFAFNLFGFYQIAVPSGILTKLSSAGGGGGYAQTLLMGLTFTLTSFTCTVPFVGTVLVATAQGEWMWPVLGMLGFSVVFASPFFILALLPGALTALPKSGGWLNSVKVTMGFLEVAAAMKFISNVDLVWHWRFFTREVVLAIWIAIAFLAMLYLLGNFRFPHDSPLESLGAIRMMSATAFLSLAFYLFTGLMGGSLGELDAFLPPRTSGALALTGGGTSGKALEWQTSREAAFALARRENKPIFIDFTGYTCTNCRWMESNIFPLVAVQNELERYVRLQLFTDGEGPQYEENQNYQKEQFGTVALPLYAILDSQGKTIATFPGMTRKPEEFLAFLRKPFETPRAGAQQALSR
jgi:thiol:disulfide interchange protein